MKYKKLSVNFVVDDINKSIAFYRDILKFNVTMSVPEAITQETEIKWVAMKRDQVEIMFQLRKSAIKSHPEFNNQQPGGSLTLYLEMEGIDQLYKEIKDKVTLVQDMHTEFYGMREFSIKDCNNFILTFAEKIKA